VETNGDTTGRGALLYLLVTSGVGLGLILINVPLGMIIPFRVEMVLGYVWTLIIFVGWHAILTKGWKRSLLMLAVSFVIAFTAEALGVNFGLVFGHYYYTPKLGFQIVGVPLQAALTWEPILYAAFLMTDLVAPSPLEPGAPWRKKLPAYLRAAGIGAVATTAWDLMIDPVAVSDGWWVWRDGGAYVPYVQTGVPVSNYLGWLGVSFTIIFLYKVITGWAPAPRRSPALSIYSPLAFYSSLCLTAAGVTITVWRRPEIALVGLMAMGPFMLIALTNVLRPGLAPGAVRSEAQG
jgi:uncharacterized membrane protein